MRYPIQVATLTDAGVRRTENQDAVSHIYDERSDTHLLVVADGMGGAACGSRASQEAVRVIGEMFFEKASATLKTPDRLRRALIAANHAIWEDAKLNVQCKGMGATCALLAMLKDQGWSAHIGDSRIYQVSPDRIRRLTRDHSHVQRMLEDGLISEEEAQRHPDRSRIERALGPREIAKPELATEPFSLIEGDQFVLCTDGLTSLVHDEEIFGIVKNAPSAQACATLIELAKQRGGHDNITVAIATIGDEVTRAF
ncbi:MAG: serine/threonine-protein phosphatase [Acidobacteria bacterium]|nr:serine/threonine-protein phosphatase [Acidobacteriota bacterium]